ncbi:S1/P1 Nuclease [Flammeovirga sp. MY04]|uniref:zinc dependent phospholipase C family protein n=1 Tax=Flammeovirga sp. MY04 TaxID=1191459 RepID=UPI000806144F|nr:zinc dependent phospholipase C family protein [Flammeovirga sp. MY04]ANQ51320.1 S1/P1 Nuclease [Flammeovirga sp. MY04]
MKTFTLLFSFWGFFAHQEINLQATFLLPDEMFFFFKSHINELKKGGIRPDQRKGLLDNEGSKHYIDIEFYDSLLQQPIKFDDALLKYSNDSLLVNGMAPWVVTKYYFLLRKAFEEKDAYLIIKYAGEVGHYYGDLHVPLHTTHNYNGQLTNQVGIHAFWESTLPENYYPQYNIQLENAHYIDNIQETVWEAMRESHSLVKTVLNEEKKVSAAFGDRGKYVVKRRGATLQLQPSKKYAEKYNEAVGGMVSARMQLSIQRIANLWFTCWVDAGQPDLKDLKYKVE